MGGRRSSFVVAIQFGRVTRKMHSNAALAFEDIDDFQTAMGAEGVTSLTVTQRGRFEAFLTQVSLQSVSLAAVRETLPRIAFVRVPEDRVLLSFSFNCAVPQIWGGRPLHSQDLIMIGPRQGVHARLAGPCQWANIWIPTKALIDYARVVSDDGLSVPTGVCAWRPPTCAARELRDLHFAAVRATHAQSPALTSSEATHGLEQQVLDALLLGLSERPLTAETADQIRRHELMDRLEDLLNIQPDGEPSVAKLSDALGVPANSLGSCCKDRFGMNLSDYLKIRRLQSAHRQLRRAGTVAMRVADIAERYGFRDPGQFADAYRDFFGELPSTTLRRTQREAFPPLLRRRGTD